MAYVRYSDSNLAPVYWKKICDFIGEIKPGTKILDVGTGTGNFPLHLQRMGYTTVGIERDFDDELLRYELETDSSPLRERPLVKADAFHLPFPNDCFDLVTSVALFPSALDNNYSSILPILTEEGERIAEKISSEINRVLKPGCYYVILEDILGKVATRKPKGGWSFMRFPDEPGMPSNIALLNLKEDSKSSSQ